MRKRSGDRRPTLVIGFGNTLRGDDGVGPRIARAVARWGCPDVEAIAAHQLTPELAARVTEADSVIFVDARIAESGGEQCEAIKIDSSGATAEVGHTCSPALLLILALRAFGREPPAHLITVPAFDLNLGEGLSAATRGVMRTALRLIAAHLPRDHHATSESNGGESHACTSLA
jgi:hydrogenase maturation protease